MRVAREVPVELPILTEMWKLLLTGLVCQGPISDLAAEYQSGSPIVQEKIKMLGEQYSAMRRTRGDGNCFIRSFMFSYLEHLLETQDEVEVVHITENIEQCKKTLQSLGYADFIFEDLFAPVPVNLLLDSDTAAMLDATASSMLPAQT